MLLISALVSLRYFKAVCDESENRTIIEKEDIRNILVIENVFP